MDVTSITTDGTARETGRRMYDMARRYRRDMAPFAHMSAYEVFDLVKSVPFRPDPPDEEVLQRPLYTLSGQGTGGDCDDKCIALAAWAFLVGMPVRFVAVRRADKDVIHHVMCELYINGAWMHADPTYDFNVLGRPREQYAEHVYL